MFGSYHRQMLQMLSSIEKYMETFEEKPDVYDTKVAYVSPVEGAIAFKSVSFAYPRQENDDATRATNKNALNDITFEIPAGKTVAIVGPSGSGKSTLAHLLTRGNDPDSGKISIDGLDIREIGVKHLRSSIGIVSQDPALFDESLRYNITFPLNGKAVDITDQELMGIAKASRVEQFLDKLPDGFDTIIGERGVRLSGGERQRVAIARALIKGSPIMVFDEATSSLDTVNEHEIRKSIEKVSKGRTTIVIAHRLSTIKNADMVIVLNEGEVVGQGSHSELFARCTTYRNLVEHQMVGGILN